MTTNPLQRAANEVDKAIKHGWAGGLKAVRNLAAADAQEAQANPSVTQAQRAEVCGENAPSYCRYLRVGRATDDEIERYQTATEPGRWSIGNCYTFLSAKGGIEQAVLDPDAWAARIRAGWDSQGLTGDEQLERARSLKRAVKRPSKARGRFYVGSPTADRVASAMAKES